MCWSKWIAIDINILIKVATIIIENHAIKELVKGTNTDTQHQNSAHTKKSDCFGALLTNAQCHMEPILILVYRESWTMKLKHTNETLSDTPLWSHKVLVCICFSERVYFNQLNISTIYDMYIIMNLIYGPQPRSSGGSTSRNPQVSSHIPALILLHICTHNDIKIGILSSNGRNAGPCGTPQFEVAHWLL